MKGNTLYVLQLLNSPHNFQNSLEITDLLRVLVFSLVIVGN